jgi:hypothetical protein
MLLSGHTSICTSLHTAAAKTAQYTKEEAMYVRGTRVSNYLI